MARNNRQQLIHFLSDVYSVEQQALAQLDAAPELAGTASIAEDYRNHYIETEQQAALVEDRLTALGGETSSLKNAIMKIGGRGFLLFAKSLPETPARLAAHSYAYEAMEWAAYEMLARFAEQAGDPETVKVARAIGREERQMMDRIDKKFELAEAISRQNADPAKLPEDLRRHIAEAHALESQGVQLLEKSKTIAGSADLDQVCTTNLTKVKNHLDALENRLSRLSSGPSSIKAAALEMFGLNWGLFFQAQSDTPAKLAAFIYAFEHLKIAGYTLLKIFAKRAGDAETADLADLLLNEERSMAERVAATFDSAVEATFKQVAG